MIKTSKEWTKRYVGTKKDRPPVKPEDIVCYGCLSDKQVYLYCCKCEIRNCGLSKKVKNCQVCKDYECQKLKDFKKQLY